MIIEKFIEKFILLMTTFIINIKKIKVKFNLLD